MGAGVAASGGAGGTPALPGEGASHPRRQVGEAAAAVAHGFELGKLLVAPVVAAALDQLARRREVHPRRLRELRALLGAGRLRLRRTIVDEPVERRKRGDAREREPRAFERHIAEIKPHRPRLGDLLDLVEIARGAVPIADTAAEGSTGEEAKRNELQPPCSAYAVDTFFESGLGGSSISRRSGGRPGTGGVLNCQPTLGATHDPLFAGYISG